MTKTHHKTLAVSTHNEQHKLSKVQQAFNKLIKQIEYKRTQLENWQAIIPQYQKKYTGELLPLVNTLMDKQVIFLLNLDRVYDHKEIKKGERNTISQLIKNLSNQLLESRSDVELKEIYNKHSHTDYDQEKNAEINLMKSMMEDDLGINLGDDMDIDSPEELLRQIQQKMMDELKDQEADQQYRESLKKNRKKSAKQLAKEAQQQAEEQQASLSMREVYRKLASALHPDRETDPLEQERKTTLMQRVNEAYEKKDLLQLLKLQLELEHIDQNSVNNISENRLKHYNKILKEQLTELEQEIYHVEGNLMAQFNMDPFSRVNPDSVMVHLMGEIAGINRTLNNIEKEALIFEDIKLVKAWLKTVKREAAKMDDYDDCPF